MTRRNRKKEENVQDVNGFMHEVEEAMHVETMLNFWHSYKMLIVSGFVAVFVAVTSWQWYSFSLEKGLSNQADNLWVVERSEGSKVEGYANLVNNGSQGYKLFAMLKTAQTHVESGDIKTAATIYDEVINGDASEEFKQLAAFHKGIALTETDVKQAMSLFNEIVAAEGVFAMSAKEMLGIIAEQQGNTEKAKKYYENIIVNPAIPQGLRSRVQSRLDFINRQSEKV